MFFSITVTLFGLLSPLSGLLFSLKRNGLRRRTFEGPWLFTIDYDVTCVTVNLKGRWSILSILLGDKLFYFLYSCPAYEVGKFRL